MKQLFTLALCLLAFSAFSQWNANGTHIYNGNTGSVGVGISNPDTRLHVKSNNTYYPWAGPFRVEAPSNVNMININHNGGAGTVWVGNGNSTTGPWTPLYFYTGGLITMSLGANGNVGIGTSVNVPAYKLDVNGIVNATGFYVNGVPISSSGSSQWTTSGSNIIYNVSNGNVAIGTPFTSNPNGYRLAVNGKIGAKEVIVENTSSTWADYVFNTDYQLRPLSEVESFIKDNHHLPEIPSQAEVLENGHKLGEMDVLLLKKVEELTLYLIELKKEVDALKAENNSLKKELSKN